MTLRVIIVFLAASLAVACAPAAPPADENPVRPGLRTTVKAFGHIYQTEVFEVRGGYSTWKMLWKDQVVSVFKVYRGLFAVLGREGESLYRNEIDVTLIDQLFPMEVGKEVDLEGLYQDAKTEGDGRLWVHIVIEGETEIKIKGRKVPVFVIEMSIERKSSAGRRWESRTLWYSPELGFSLKTEYRQGDESFTIRVLSMEVPAEDAAPPNRRNLGTVVI